MTYETNSDLQIIDWSIDIIKKTKNTYPVGRLFLLLEYVPANLPIRHGIEVLGPDDPHQLKLGWTCNEIIGFSIKIREAYWHD